MSVRVLSAEEVAGLLLCAVSTVNDRARSGDLPGLQFGDGGWVFPSGALALRLDELALERSQQRRMPRAPAGGLHAVSKPPKPARVPPVLPRA